jgi:hypothetical protein
MRSTGETKRKQEHFAERLGMDLLPENEKNKKENKHK